MPVLVLSAELATLAFFAVFIWALSSGAEGGGFAIETRDPVARTLLRSAQAAFLLGYGALFAYSAAEIAGAL